MYVFGSAGTSLGCDGNLEELAKWKIIPRMLRDATVRNLNVSTPPAPREHAPIVRTDYAFWRQVQVTAHRGTCGGAGHHAQGRGMRDIRGSSQSGCAVCHEHRVDA